MTDNMAIQFEEFAKKNDLALKYPKRSPSGTTILSFINIKNNKKVNIALNAYDLLNVSEKEIVMETIKEVTKKILN